MKRFSKWLDSVVDAVFHDYFILVFLASMLALGGLVFMAMRSFAPPPPAEQIEACRTKCTAGGLVMTGFDFGAAGCRCAVKP